MIHKKFFYEVKKENSSSPFLRLRRENNDNLTCLKYKNTYPENSEFCNICRCALTR